MKAYSFTDLHWANEILAEQCTPCRSYPEHATEGLYNDETIDWAYDVVRFFKTLFKVAKMVRKHLRVSRWTEALRYTWHRVMGYVRKHNTSTKAWCVVSCLKAVRQRATKIVRNAIASWQSQSEVNRIHAENLSQPIYLRGRTSKSELRRKCRQSADRRQCRVNLGKYPLS